MSENVIHLNATNFKETIASATTPVLVDFWAPWCSPCRAIGPAIEEYATQLNGQVKVAKLNVDEADTVAVEYNVRSIPALLVFKKGQVVYQSFGATEIMASREKFKEKLLSFV